MHFHLDQNQLIVDILTQIAREKNRPLERVKRLLLVSQNAAINKRFWQILDDALPGHPYTYVGCRPDCGCFELI